MKTYLPYCFIFILMLGFKNAKAKSAAVSGFGTDATLKSIVLSTATTLVFSTGASNYNYTTSVSPGTTSLTITPTTNDPAATVTVNGVPVTSGKASGAITLNGIVTTTINMVCTASDGVTTNSYSIVVYETGSNNAFLSALSVSTGNALVVSAAGAGDYNYTTSVSPTITSLTVTPTTADPTATVTVNGVAVTSGTASGAIALNAAGTTTINTVVTAQDGATMQTYSIVVSKTGSNTATLSSLSVSTGTTLTTTTGASNFNYTTAVNPAVTSLTVTPTATDPTATIKVNGVVVISGNASGAIALNASPATTAINIVVTAQDGSTTQSYAITVSRNATNTATLGALSVSTGTTLVNSAGPSNFNYTTDVSPGTASLAVILAASDPNATVTVNGVVVTSGSSGSIALNTTGTTTINILVKSQDATTTKSYGITVSENGSNNANVGSIALNPNSTLVNSVGTSDINYTTSVSNATTSVTVTPVPADATATVTVNGVAVTNANGYTSGAIALNGTGTTLISILITAQDGTTKSFGITVSKGGSNNASVGSIALNPNSTLVNSVGTSNVNYATSVAAGTATITVTTTANNNQAKISVNNGAQTVGTSVVTVTLNATGTTFIGIVLTSEDGTTTKSYGITVSLNGSNNANIAKNPVLSTGTLATSATGTSNINYTAIVSPNTTSLSVTTFTADANATISVNGFAATSGVPSGLITLNATGTTTINITITAQDGVTKKTIGIIVSKSGAIIAWTGSTSTAWNVASNWINTVTGTAQVPGAGDVADFGVSNQYTITNAPLISSAFTVAEIEFGPNATAAQSTLTITKGVTLTVGTSLTVDAGSTAIIQSSAASSASVNIAVGATVNVTGNGQLVINSSALPITFTLKSLASGSASVGQINANSIVGTVSVERYITGGSSIYRGYRLLSSPVYASTINSNNVYSVNYVKASSLVTGTNGAANGFDKAGNPSLYLFREDQLSNNGSFTGGNYWGISNIAAAPNYSLNGLATVYNIPVGNGFFFFFRGDRTTNVANKYSPGTSAESVTMVTTGTLNAGQIAVHDWYTPASANLGFTTTSGLANLEGLNLVGNPYPSSIDWDTYNSSTPSSGIYAPNVGSSIYVLDPATNNYGVYMANSATSGTNNATHIIASGQGFFVQAFDPTAQLVFNEDAKTTTQITGANLLLGKPVQNAVSQYLRLKLNQGTLQADEILISFKDNAQSNFIFGEDAVQKPGYGTANLASMSDDGVPLSINTLKLPKQSETIALNVNAASDGTYQLSVPEIKSIPLLFDIWLMDVYKKDSLNLRLSAVYNFNIIKSDATSYGSNRFSLVIRQNPALGVHLLDFTAAKASGGVQVVWKTGNEENYTNFTVERSTDGGVSFNVLGGFASSSLGTYSFLDKEPLLTANRYRLKLEDLNGTISYSNTVTLMYGNLTNNIAGNLSIYPNPASSTINLSITPFKGSSVLQTNSIQNTTASTVSYGIKIINITGSVIKTANSSTPSWQDDVSSLTPGTYIIQVINNGDKSVVGKSTFVKL